MSDVRHWVAACTVLILTLAACSPSSGTGAGALSSGGAASLPKSALVFLTQAEPPSLSEHRALFGTSGSSVDAKRLFNAGLYLADLRGVAQPLLVQQGPQLDTDSWRVNPDGTMDTVYHLRPNLTWHDGTPFTADDMVLSWQMAKNPDYGVSALKPINLMEQATALDEQTVAMHWTSTYPGADALVGRDWAPLPGHVLATAIQSDSAQAVLAQPYWTTQYLGLGPYKLAEWQPGAFIAGTAFDNYALGRPKIDRIEIRVAGDPNVVVVTLLSGAAQIAFDRTLGFEQGAVLQKQGLTDNGGKVLLSANNLRTIAVQFKPEYTNPPEIMDPRVRKALAYALDKQGLVDGLQGGQGQVAEGFLVPGQDYYERALQAITKYPRDLAQADRSMQSAGLVKQSDGYYTADGRRFSPELRASASDQEAREQAITADAWKQLGVDVQTRLLSAEEYKDGELRSAYPAFFNVDTVGIAEEVVYVKLYGPNAATAATRWQGSNRGGYSNPEYDRLYEQLTTSLERGPQIEAIIKAAKLVSDDAVLYPLYYNDDVKAATGAVRGPQPYAPGGNVTWAIEQWEWAR